MNPNDTQKVNILLSSFKSLVSKALKVLQAGIKKVIDVVMRQPKGENMRMIMISKNPATTTKGGCLVILETF